MTPLKDIPGAAEFLGVEPSWVRDKVTARQIPFTKIGRHIRFTEEHLAAIVAAGEQTPVQAPNRPRTPIPSRKRMTT